MKDIIGFSNYQICQDGKVWSKYSNKFLKPLKNSLYGYDYYRLIKDGKQHHKVIHRLVADNFIPNPDNLEFVDHIDRDTTNNNLSNLRWVSQSENNINRKRASKSGYRHICFIQKKGKNPFYTLQIVRNRNIIYYKYFNINEYTLQDIVKYRNEVVYPQFNIEIDD